MHLSWLKERALAVDDCGPRCPSFGPYDDSSALLFITPMYRNISFNCVCKITVCAPFFQRPWSVSVSTLKLAMLLWKLLPIHPPCGSWIMNSGCSCCMLFRNPLAERKRADRHSFELPVVSQTTLKPNDLPMFSHTLQPQPKMTQPCTSCLPEAPTLRHPAVRRGRRPNRLA